jgi:hypothetical protein
MRKVLKRKTESLAAYLDGSYESNRSLGIRRVHRLSLDTSRLGFVELIFDSLLTFSLLSMFMQALDRACVVSPTVFAASEQSCCR